jgi:hypothetical protein
MTEQEEQGAIALQTLNGHVTAWYTEDEPVQMEFEGQRHVLIFNDEETLHAVIERVKITRSYTVSRIVDAEGFINDLNQSGLRACFDVHLDADGKSLHYTILKMPTLSDTLSVRESGELH